MSGHDPRFARLVEFLSLIPAVEADDTPARGMEAEASGAGWRVGFVIDVFHDLSWETVQELAHALNGSGVASFKPVSPAPDQNGGPDEFLSWVIEGGARSPDEVADHLRATLPSPVESERAWIGESDAGEDDDADDDEGGEIDDEVGDGGDY